MASPSRRYITRFQLNRPRTQASPRAVVVPVGHYDFYGGPAIPVPRTRRQFLSVATILAAVPVMIVLLFTLKTGGTRPIDATAANPTTDAREPLRYPITHYIPAIFCPFELPSDTSYVYLAYMNFLCVEMIVRSEVGLDFQPLPWTAQISNTHNNKWVPQDCPNYSFLKRAFTCNVWDYQNAPFNNTGNVSQGAVHATDDISWHISYPHHNNTSIVPNIVLKVSPFHIFNQTTLWIQAACDHARNFAMVAQNKVAAMVVMTMATVQRKIDEAMQCVHKFAMQDYHDFHFLLMDKPWLLPPGPQPQCPTFSFLICAFTCIETADNLILQQPHDDDNAVFSDIEEFLPPCHVQVAIKYLKDNTPCPISFCHKSYFHCSQEPTDLAVYAGYSGLAAQLFFLLTVLLVVIGGKFVNKWCKWRQHQVVLMLEHMDINVIPTILLGPTPPSSPAKPETSDLLTPRPSTILLNDIHPTPNSVVRARRTRIPNLSMSTFLHPATSITHQSFTFKLVSSVTCDTLSSTAILVPTYPSASFTPGDNDKYTQVWGTVMILPTCGTENVIVTQSTPRKSMAGNVHTQSSALGFENCISTKLGVCQSPPAAPIGGWYPTSNFNSSALYNPLSAASITLSVQSDAETTPDEDGEYVQVQGMYPIVPTCGPLPDHLLFTPQSSPRKSVVSSTDMFPPSSFYLTNVDPVEPSPRCQSGTTTPTLVFNTLYSPLSSTSISQSIHSDAATTPDEDGEYVKVHGMYPIVPTCGPLPDHLIYTPQSSPTKSVVSTTDTPQPSSFYLTNVDPIEPSPCQSCSSTPKLVSNAL